MPDLDLRVCRKRRVVIRHRRIQTEEALTIGHTHGGGQQAFGHRPGQVWRGGSGRRGVALVNHLAIADHQQGIGTYALAGGVIAGREGIVFQLAERGAGRDQLAVPVVARPILGVRRGAA